MILPKPTVCKGPNAQLTTFNFQRSTFNVQHPMLRLGASHNLQRRKLLTRLAPKRLWHKWNWRLASCMTPEAFDLHGRLVDFAVVIIDVVRVIPSDRAGHHIANQLVRCGTAPAAHHSEAQGAESRRDFIHKMRLGLKELRETRTWLEITARTQSQLTPLQKALEECSQLIAIFSASVQTASRKNRCDGDDRLSARM